MKKAGLAMHAAIVLFSAAIILVSTPSLLAQNVMLPPSDAPRDGVALRTDWGGVDDGRDLWDNGRPNGFTGLSNAVEEVFGFRRTLLMDFVVPDGQSWRVEGLRWLHIWNTVDPPAGTGLEIRFYDDSGSRPGMPITSIMTQVSYEEIATGEVWFSRLGAKSTSVFESLAFASGRYWTDMTIVGADNNFWLTADVIDNPVWVDYADFGGLQPGLNVFGMDYDINGVLTGSWFSGNYTLELEGQCPGQLTLLWNGANPNTRHAIIFGRRLRTTRIPDGFPCAGTILGVSVGLRLVTPPGLFSTGDGSGAITGPVGPRSCFSFVQLIEQGSCNTSNVAQIP